MKRWLNLLIIILVVFVTYKAVYFYCVYKDEFLSREARMSLKGKIAYSVKGHQIKVVDVASGKSSAVYIAPKHLIQNFGFVHNPSFSPQGDRIVFSQSRQLFDDKLYIMDSNGTNIELCVDLHSSSTICPSWSPDGWKIAFLVDNEPWQGLYILDLHNNSINHISNLSPFKSQPSWSPDSKLIVFFSGIKERELIGNNMYQEVTDGGAYVIDIESKKVKNFFRLASEASWSPDGRYLVYSNINGYYLVNINKEGYDSNEKFLFTSKKPLFGFGGVFPIRFSPDGKYIAFCKEIWPGLAGIYVCLVDNPKKQIRITFDDQAIIGMSWGK